MPEEMRNNPELWSDCTSGALRENEFLKAFADVGFHGIAIEKWDEQPWQVIAGIEFRSVTVTAYKGKEGPCEERNQAVIYRGPWNAVIDDDGHTLYRGERMAVCDKTYNLYKRAPYSEQIIPIDPHEKIPVEKAASFNCSKNARWHPSETKGLDYATTRLAEGLLCGDDGCC